MHAQHIILFSKVALITNGNVQISKWKRKENFLALIQFWGNILSFPFQHIQNLLLLSISAPVKTT